MIDRLIWDGVFRGRFADKTFAIEIFQRHNGDVRRVIPPERLLAYEVDQGWGPSARSWTFPSRRISRFLKPMRTRSSVPGSDAPPCLCASSLTRLSR